MKINDALSMLRSLYFDWQHMLANPNFIRKDNQVTWNNNKRIFLDEPITYDDVALLCDEKQYSFQLIDGSLIQLYYSFDGRGKTVSSASLSYFAYKNETSNQLDVDYEIDEKWKEEESLSDNLFASWVRLDYNPSEKRTVVHNDSHLHISSFPNSRLAVKGIPTPKQFVEFIIALCYPEVYKKHRLGLDGNYLDRRKMVQINRKKVPFPRSDVFQHITHIVVPGN